jgi:hypothetical protein
VLNGCTLVSDLDRQFRNLPNGLREILLSIIHFSSIPAVNLPLLSMLARERAAVGSIPDIGTNSIADKTYISMTARTHHGGAAPRPFGRLVGRNGSLYRYLKTNCPASNRTRPGFLEKGEHIRRAE